MLYIIGVQDYIRREFKLFACNDIKEASIKAIVIEGKVRHDGTQGGANKGKFGDLHATWDDSEKEKGKPNKKDLFCIGCEQT